MPATQIWLSLALTICPSKPVLKQNHLLLRCQHHRQVKLLSRMMESLGSIVEQLLAQQPLSLVWHGMDLSGLLWVKEVLSLSRLQMELTGPHAPHRLQQQDMESRGMERCG